MSSGLKKDIAPMKHIDKETLLARWLSGTLSSEEQSFIDQEDTQDLQQLLNDVNRLQMPAIDQGAMWKRIKTQRQEQVQRTKIRRRIRLGSMAAMLIFVVGLFGGYQNAHQTIQAQGTSIATELPDGTSIQMNVGTTISYNSLTWRFIRQLDMQGEAFFKVKPGSLFAVHTTQGSIKVLGTAFNIIAATDFLAVQCHEGIVEVVAEMGDDYQLVAGDKVVLNEGDKAELLSELPVSSQKPAWTKQESRFVGEQLAHVFKDWSLRYGVEVNLPPELKSELFTGRFVHDNLEKSLYMICDPMGLIYEMITPSKIQIKQKE